MKQGNRLQNLVLAALLAAVMAVVAPFSIPIGPVPITLGLFCVALMGALLAPLPAAASFSVYMLLGLVGIPVFSGWGAGPGVLLGPTGGYLFGYYLLLLAVSCAVRWVRPLWLHFLAGAVGLAACYALGTAWYMVYAGASLATALALCVVPFILPDLAKIAAALLLARAFEKRLRKGAV